jgi:hypothetical protein
MTARLMMVFSTCCVGFYMLHWRNPDITISPALPVLKMSSTEPGKSRGTSYEMSSERPIRSSTFFYPVIILDIVICLVFGWEGVRQTFFNPSSSSYHTPGGYILIPLIGLNFCLDLVFIHYWRKSPEKIDREACFIKGIIGIISIFSFLSGLYFLISYLFNRFRVRRDPTPEPVRTATPPQGPPYTFTPRLDALSARAANLTVFRAQAESLVANCRANLPDTPASHGLFQEAESGIGLLELSETKLLQWSRQGYDTGNLESLRAEGLQNIRSGFSLFEQRVGQLEKIRADLTLLTRNNPWLVSREEFRSSIASIESQLKDPDAVGVAGTGLESLKKRIGEYPRAQERYDKQLKDQIDRIRQSVSDGAVMEETDRIRKTAQAGDLPAAVELLRSLAAGTLLRVDESISALRREGAVIPGSIGPVRPDPDHRKYSDRIIEAVARLEELDRLRRLFEEATFLKGSVTDSGLLERYDAGDYQEFITGYKKRTGFSKEAGLIFISAKSEDYPYAHQVHAFLTDKKYDVFFSKDTLPELGNCEFGEAIDAALDRARHIIIVTSSRENVRSKWVKSEWRMFLDEKRAGRKRGNIITLLAGTMKIEDLPIGLRSYETQFLNDPGSLELILHYLN